MGFPSYCLSMLLLLSSTQVRYSAEGRSMFKLVGVSKEGGGERMVMVSSMIGSRPPRCERRCTSCGRCEAVQVPVVPPQDSSGIRRSSKTITSRGDDNSNYKPMNWKCKCGDMILNP